MMLLVIVLAFGLGFGGTQSYLQVSKDDLIAYNEQGRMLFSIAPEPYARAGEMNGYMFHFEDGIERFKGKTLTIMAVQLQTGRVEIVSSEKIVTPNPGYPGLERYTVRFTLPLEGKWRLDVKLDDQPYGSVSIVMNAPSWESSPMFQTENFWLRGIENQIGFIDSGFVAGSNQKYLWHFWGSDEELNGPFQVFAVKEGSLRLIEVFSSNGYSSANALGSGVNGADRSIPTTMMLPEKGRWRLLPYVQGHLLSTIVVDVK